MLTTILLSLLGLATATPPAPAQPVVPDVIPEGYHGVPVDRKLDLDAFREHCCTQHVVAAGETLSMIARRHLGSSRRVQDITALNPDLNPRRIKIGRRIWLPPRDAKAPHSFLYFTSWPGQNTSSPFAIGDRVYARYGGYAFVIVDDQHRAEFTKAKDWKRVVTMDKDKKLQIVNGSSVRGLVKDDSGIHSIQERIKAVRNAKGRFSIEYDVQYLDAKGKKIVEGAKNKKKATDQMWLLLVALGGAGLIVFRARARTPAQIAVA